MNEKIICDTNVWYNNSNFSNRNTNIKLVATAVNIVELAASPNLESDIMKVYDAIKNLLMYADIVIFSNPIEYLIKNFFSEFTPNSNGIKKRYSEFNKFITLNVNDLMEENEIMNEQIKKIENDKTYLADLINSRLPEVRANIKKSVTKEKHRNTIFIEYWKGFIIEHIMHYSKRYFQTEIKIMENDKKWSNFHFFLTVWEEYFKEIELRGNGKIDKNDISDLFNMVYVKPGLKYWTLEKKWNRIINSSTETKTYIYQTEPKRVFK